MNKSEPSLFVGKGKSVGLPPSSMKRRKNIFPLPLLDEKALLQAFKNEGIAALHAYTIWRHIIQKGITDVVDIPGLPRKAYALIKQRFVLCTSKLKERKDSKDGSTTKLLITLQDGRSIESVIMRYGAVELSSFPEDKLEAQRSASRLFKSNNRSTLCVSSQVGCQMGCTFCATGTMGLLANLTSGEILEQLYLASQIEKIRNIVFMGMGEPLDNYAEVVLSIRGMMDVRRYNLSSHRITISTVGVVPRIKQLANEIPGVSLALSLHAPTQALRLKIVPSSKAWPIDKLMEAIDFFVETQKTLTATMQRNQFIMIEYVLIADVNDSPSTAHDVGMLLQPRLQRVLLNVIPYNPTNVPMNYRSTFVIERIERRFHVFLLHNELKAALRGVIMPCEKEGSNIANYLLLLNLYLADGGEERSGRFKITPSQTSIDTFVDIIRTYDVKVTIRQELGTDISGACGQLVVENGTIQPSTSTITSANIAQYSVEIEDSLCLRSISSEKNSGSVNDTASAASVSSQADKIHAALLPLHSSAECSMNNSEDENNEKLNVATKELEFLDSLIPMTEHSDMSLFQRIWKWASNICHHSIKESHIQISYITLGALVIGISVYLKRK